MIQQYRVEWIIDLDADTPEEAARLALAIVRDPSQSATVFSCTDEEGEKHDVDIYDLDQIRASARFSHASH